MNSVKNLTVLPDLEYYKRLSELLQEVNDILEGQNPYDFAERGYLRLFKQNFIPQSAVKEALREKP